MLVPHSLPGAGQQIPYADDFVIPYVALMCRGAGLE